MKKALKSFLSRFLVCFKNRKVSSSLIRPEIEKDPAAGLNVGEEIKAAGLNAGKEIKLVGRHEEPAAGIEASEEERAAGIEAVGIDPEEEAVTWIEAGEEEPAAGIDVGEEIKATGINVGEEIKVGGWREEPAEGIQEPAVGVQAEEEPAVGIEAGEEEPAVGIQAEEEPAARIKAGEEETAGDEETTERFDAGDDEPTAGIQAGQGESAAEIEAEVETLTGIDAGNEESTVQINAEEELATGIKAGKEELATGIEVGKEELAAVIEQPLIGINADRDDLEEPMLEGFVLEVQLAEAEGGSVAAQGASFSEVLEAFVSMNLKLHTLTAQLASLNADLEAHRGVNNYLEEKFTWKLPGGLFDSISPTMEVPILGLTTALDAEEAFPFANAEIQKEVNLKGDTMKQETILEVRETSVSADVEEDFMKRETILEVREASGSADLEVQTLTVQLASLSAELELSVAADEMLINLEELTLKPAKTLVVEEGFIFSTVELLASDVSLSSVGFDIGEDVEEGQGDVNDVDWDAMNDSTSDVKEGDVDLEDEGRGPGDAEGRGPTDGLISDVKNGDVEGRGPTDGLISDVKEGDVDREDEGRGAMNGWTFDVKEGDVDLEDEGRGAINGWLFDVKVGEVDLGDEEGRGTLNDGICDEKEGDVNSEDDDRGALNDWASNVRESDVDSEDWGDQVTMNGWIGDVKEGDIGSEDGEDRVTMNDWIGEVKEIDIGSEDGEDRVTMNGSIGDVKEGDIGSEDGEDQGKMNGWICDVKEGDVYLEDDEDRGTMKDWISDVNAQDGEDRGMNDCTCDLKGGTKDEEDQCTMNDWTGDVKEGDVGSEDEDRDTVIGGICDANKGDIYGGDEDVEGEGKWDEAVRNDRVRSNIVEDLKLKEYEDGPAEEWDEGTQNGRTRSYVVEEENGDVNTYNDGGDVYREDNIDVKEGHHELANELQKQKVFEVFIGGLHMGVTEDDLRNVFNQVGEITGVRLPMNHLTKKNRGFAFLRFATKEQADRAILDLKNPFINGRRCRVTSSWGWDAEPEDEVMTQVTTIFIDGLPTSWDEDRVKNLVMRFGDTEKIKLARNIPTARKLDFGFVTFKTHEAAIACVEDINNDELVKGDEQVNLRARLSRPFVWGRGKHAPVEFRPGKGVLGGRLLRNAPPHIEFGGCGPGGGFRGRGAPGGGRSIGFANRHPMMYGSDGARRLQYSNHVYNCKPQGDVYSLTDRPKNYRHGGYEGHRSGGGCGDDRWSSSLHSGFLPYGSDDVGCSSYSSYSGYSREGRYFGGKTRDCCRV